MHGRRWRCRHYFVWVRESDYVNPLKSINSIKGRVPEWTKEGIQRLQACFDCTDWTLFIDSSADLDECAQVTVNYITFCEDLCILKESVIRYPNDKPRLDRSVNSALRARYTTFKRRHTTSLNRANYRGRRATIAANTITSFNGVLKIWWRRKSQFCFCF